MSTEGSVASAKILIVEDEAALAELLRYNLEAEGFSVDISDNGEQAELAIAESPPDLIVLDWMLPGVSGLELCRRLRSGKTATPIPILMVTARAEEADRVRGLSIGADDYVTKPFSVRELLARVRALLRRSSPRRLANVLEGAGITLDRDGQQATRNERRLRLGPTEYRLLEFFMQSQGRVLSRAQILDSVWGRDVYVDERTVDVHIGRLRRCLIRGKERDPIRTVRGSGYVFDGKP